jgi:hypothetical protein
MKICSFQNKLTVSLLSIFLITIFLNACGGKYQAIKKSMKYVESGDLKPISENEKRPLVIPANGPSNYNENKSFYEVYRTLGQLADYEKNFDLAGLKYYSSSAYLQNTRYYSFGKIRTMVISVRAHADLLKDLIEDARNDNDYSEYSDYRFAEEGNGYVRVSAKRYSVKKRYESDISWLFGKNDSGRWVIIEEISESMP